MEGQGNLINLKALPEGLREQVKQDIQKYGEPEVFWMLQMAPIQKMIKSESEQGKSDPDVWFQMMTHIVDNLASTDPHPPHYASARTIIASTEKGEPEDQPQEAANMLAVELVTHCHNIKKLVLRDLTPLQDDKGKLILVNENGQYSMGLVTSEDEMLWLDKILLDYISTVGPEGKSLAEDLVANFQDRHKTFNKEGKKNMKQAWKLWVSSDQTFSPPYLNVLCDVAWKDVIKPRWEKKKRLKTPAISKKLWTEPVQKLLVKGNQTLESQEVIECRSCEGQLLARAEVAAVEKSLISLISGGFKDLSTLTGHKTYRWLVRTGFENVIFGGEECDHRLIQTAGGYKGIADLIGCTAKDDPQRVKRILHAMGHGRLELPDGRQGNLIALEVVKKARNGHPSAINIVLGTMLLPHYVFDLSKRNSLLVPVPELPEFVADTSSHAAQSMLQLLVFEEFSNRSRELATKKYIQLTEEKWESFGRKAHLAKSVLPKVKDRWTQEDGMLERDGEYYTLNKKKHSKELEFLIEQGTIRENQSKRKKRSGQKKGKRGAKTKKA